jgi:hypothetical protein
MNSTRAATAFAREVILDAVRKLPADAIKAVVLAAVEAQLNGLPALAKTRGNRSVPPSKTPRAPAKSKPARVRAKGEKRSPGDIVRMQATLCEVMVPGKGMTAEQLAVATGYSTKAMVLPLRKLLSSGAIRTEGKARATRYYPAGPEADAVPGRRRHPRITPVPREEISVPVSGAPYEMVLDVDGDEQAAE